MINDIYICVCESDLKKCRRSKRHGMSSFEDESVPNLSYHELPSNNSQVFVTSWNKSLPIAMYTSDCG